MLPYDVIQRSRRGVKNIVCLLNGPKTSENRVIHNSKSQEDNRKPSYDSASHTLAAGMQRPRLQNKHRGRSGETR